MNKRYATGAIYGFIGSSVSVVLLDKLGTTPKETAYFLLAMGFVWFVILMLSKEN